jgi:dihydropteroate synthase
MNQPPAQIPTWGDRTHLMGVLNVTPDSFSDGGQFDTPERAIVQARALLQAGADILDIGGQSARPGAETVSVQLELDRTLPVIAAIRAEVSDTVVISIDTTRVAVARGAIAAGANWLNDISGGRFEPEMLSLPAELGVPIVLMHSRGTPQTMQSLTEYEDLVAEVAAFLANQAQQVLAAGARPEQIILDPGLGFAKTAEQSLALLQGLPRLCALGYPLLVGPSRKSFIGKILDQPDATQRVWGTAAACCGAIAAGADILRVHDVAQMYDVCRVADAIWRDRVCDSQV